MAVSDNAALKAKAETYLGFLTAAELVDIDERYGRWGHVGYASLELLLVRLSSMVGDPLVTRIEGDAQWDWRQNLPALRLKIAALAAILAADDPSTAQQELLDLADASVNELPIIKSVDYDVENTRLMTRRV